MSLELISGREIAKNGGKLMSQPLPTETLNLEATPSKETTNPSRVVIERYLGALERGDRAAAKLSLANHVTSKIRGRNPMAGTHVGAEAVLDAAEMMRQLSNGSYSVVATLAWLNMGPHVHRVTAERASRGGQTFDFNRTTTYVIEAGQIVAMESYEDDQYAFDAFWT
jgi:ketosteroid isomerase-like protein